MNTTHKLMCAALLIALWAVLVLLDKTPVEPLITTIRDVLFALGIFHATMTNPKG